MFDGSDWEVELELDLSIKQQFLDIEEMTLKKLQETKALIERRLAESQKKKMASSRATKSRRKTVSESH